MPEHRPEDQEGGGIDELLAGLVLESLLAQQDVTRVADPTQEQPEMGELENFLLNLVEGLDPSMGAATNIAGLRPDDPNIGLQLALGLLTGGSLVKGVGKGVAKAGRGISDLFSFLMDADIGEILKKIAPSSSRSLERLHEPLVGLPSPSRIVRDFRDATEEANLLKEIRLDRSARDVRSEIFQGLKVEEPIDLAEHAFQKLIDQIDELARNRIARSGGN